MIYFHFFSFRHRGKGRVLCNMSVNRLQTLKTKAMNTIKETSLWIIYFLATAVTVIGTVILN